MLVPRPETETIVEAALDFVVRGGLRMEKLRVLDIGTGSGALLLALLHELPNAAGTGTDVSTAALQVARANADFGGFKSRSHFVDCDIASGVEGGFDLVVSNPPYIAHDEIASLPPEVRDYDPTVALDGGDDELVAYRAIAGEAKRLLAPGGRLFVELGLGQEEAVRTLFTNAGLTVGIARKDLAESHACSASVSRHEHGAFPPHEKRRPLLLKKPLDYDSETTSFLSRNRPVTVASPEPGARRSVR